MVYIQITLVPGRPDELKQRPYRAIADQPVDYSWGRGEAQLLGLGPVPGATR